jgi:glutathione S-transferase
VLATTAGTYCVGDDITMADLYLEPQVYNANRFNVDMSQFPTIARIAAAVAALPEFQAAHPSQQPDAQ